MRKPSFCICEQRRGIIAFVFTTQIVQSVDFINPKCQASSHLLCLHSPVCVGLGRKTQRQVLLGRCLYQHHGEQVYQTTYSQAIVCYSKFVRGKAMPIGRDPNNVWHIAMWQHERPFPLLRLLKKSNCE